MSEDLFQQLKEKYVSALSVLNREKIHVEKLNLENNKLLIRAQAPSAEAKNKFWDAVKRVDQNFSKDLIADISVAPATSASAAQPQAVPPGVMPASGQASTPGKEEFETYTVVKGDTLSRIAKQYYGNANDYMRIFEANRDQLNDPDKIQIGQHLKIPKKPGAA